MFRSLVALLPKPLKALGVRFDRSPIDTLETLTQFVQTRASYVAQTSLYGYLKARMGTKYRVMFEDDVFSAAIHGAAVKIFVSCLADLTTFAVATASRGTGLEPEMTASLAMRCFKTAMERGLDGVETDKVPVDALADFDRRTRQTNWADAAQGQNAFAGSGTDLILYAPVVDEFKDLDQENVANSIRFRWRDVREQLRKRIDAGAVCNDWRIRRG